MNTKITYGITVCNEYNEIETLLTFLFKIISKEDDIVVLHDLSNTNSETHAALKKFTNKPNFSYFNDNFEGHFGCWKNKLKMNCNGDYIFFLDADELLNQHFVHNLKHTISQNPNIDLFYVPRINTVKGLTDKHIKKWKLNLNEREWINFPDYQIRLVKNVDYIFWTNSVHEHLTGATSPMLLPAEEKFSIIHEKEIARQEQQNARYEVMETNPVDNRLNIIYRTCDSINVTSSSNQKRDFGTKQQIIKACFTSVIEALHNFNGHYKLFIVADHISNELESFFESFTEVSKIYKTLTSGNGASFSKCLDVALTCFDSILFLEDDYFVDKDIFNEMLFFKNKITNNPKFLHKHICLYPLDENWYDSKPEKTTILTGFNRHWKSINHTCCTFLIDDFILKDQITNLRKYKYYGTPHINNNHIEDHTINLMYKKFPCFSPLPALAEHLQFFNCLSPFSKFKNPDYIQSTIK